MKRTSIYTSLVGASAVAMAVANSTFSKVRAKPAEEKKPEPPVKKKKRRKKVHKIGRTIQVRSDGSYNNEATRLNLAHVPDNYISDYEIAKACKRAARWMKNNPDRDYSEMPQHIYEKACLMNSVMS